jgi:AbrB family looped-hinge helix DNA binding protein
VATTRISTKGQVVIPKAVREALGLRPGDELTVELENGAIRLVPRKKGLEEALKALPGHPPRIEFENEEALFEAEKREAKRRWTRE